MLFRLGLLDRGAIAGRQTSKLPRSQRAPSRSVGAAAAIPVSRATVPLRAGRAVGLRRPFPPSGAGLLSLAPARLRTRERRGRTQAGLRQGEPGPLLGQL